MDPAASRADTPVETGRWLSTALALLTFAFAASIFFFVQTANPNPGAFRNSGWLRLNATIWLIISMGLFWNQRWAAVLCALLAGVLAVTCAGAFLTTMFDGWILASLVCTALTALSVIAARRSRSSATPR